MLPLALASCGGAGATDARYPPSADGCAVQTFESPPPMPTDNIGSVRSRCGADIARADCLRELKNQACRLGADVIWGLADAPRVVDDENEWSGRAAHTK